MRYRNFGNTGLRVSEIGIGGSHFGSIINQKSNQEISRTLLKALDNGINFYDTADIYGQGDSERLIGKTFKGKRSQIIIASKAGFKISTPLAAAAKIKPLIRPLIHLLAKPTAPVRGSLVQMRSAQNLQNFNSSYLIQAVEASLRRLQTDYLDLFQLHEPPSNVLEDNEIISTLETLKSQGKIRFYGVACRTVDDAVVCLKNPSFSSIQVEFNIINQVAAKQLFPLIQREEVGIIARQPFASGLILKLFNGDNSLSPNFVNYADALSRLEKLSHFSTQDIDSLTQIALKFVLQFQKVSVVVAGMRSLNHLEQNLSAINSTEDHKDALGLLMES